MSERCRICHEWDFWGQHVCPPAWQVVESQTYKNEWVTEKDWEECHEVVYAADEESAACKIRELNSDDYERSEEIVIFVRKNEESPVTKFNVYREYVPSYTAYKQETREYVGEEGQQEG